MNKIAVIGAGNVGGMTALRILDAGIGEVVLVDVAANLAQAKASDMEDAQNALGRSYSISAGNDFSKIKNARIVIITAGLARKPGMRREDLLVKNAQIVESVALKVSQYAKDAVCIVVSNPVDIMTYLFLKAVGGSRQRIFGMGMNLDASRFANLIGKRLNIDPIKIKPVVMGAHGQNMLPLSRLTMVDGKALTSLLSDKEINELEAQTIGRGANIVGLYGSGSAYFAPSAALLALVEAIVNNSNLTVGVSVCLEGEYGIHDASIGVPVSIGREGINKIIELDLNQEELSNLQASATAIKDNIKRIKNIG